ncbi:hypothetical protein DCAR_0311051 [Daucus carota subsp. sativus]|uniref:Cytochrome P450 n=1 Tax=Daucus carota subsp. sativus TaxID=79200 RepID=A0AAF1AQJ4_DAUCS|nr:hypothetical protein DCAR_0311051 [Daucus carota subsp. sativus]
MATRSNPVLISHDVPSRTTPFLCDLLFIHGLPTIDGSEWTTHRRLLNPAFHAEKLKGMLPAFDLCCYEMTTKWMEMIGEERNSSTSFHVLHLVVAIKRDKRYLNYKWNKQTTPLRLCNQFTCLDSGKVLF